MALLRVGLAMVLFSLGTIVYGDDPPKQEDPKGATPPATTPEKPKAPQKAIVANAVGKLVSVDKDKITITISSQQLQRGVNGRPSYKTVTKDMTFDMAEEVRVKLVRASGSSTAGSMADVEKGEQVQLDLSDFKEKDEKGKTQHVQRVTKIEVATNAKKKSPAIPL